MKIPTNISYKAIDLAKAVFLRDVRDRLNASFSGVFFGSLKITLEATSGKDCYTFLRKPGWAVIHLSLKMACKVANLDPDAEVNGVDRVLGVAKVMQIALESFAYHEMSHLLGTDMTGEAFQSVDQAYYWAIDFIKQVSNLLEDPVAEKLMSHARYYGFTAVYFRFLAKRLFLPQAAQYQDDGSVPALLNYLLLYLRCGPKAIASGNAKFDALSKKGMMDRVREALREKDAKLRCKKQVAFAIWLIDELGLKQEDVDSIDKAASIRPVIILIDPQKGGKGAGSVLQPSLSALPPVSIVEAGEGEGGKSPGNQEADIIDLRTNKQSSEGEDETQQGKSADQGRKGSDENGDEGQDLGLEWGEDEAENGGDPSEDAVLSSSDPDLESAIGLDAYLAQKSFSDVESHCVSDVMEIVNPLKAQTAFDDAAKSCGVLSTSLADSLIELKAETAPYEVRRLPSGEEIDIDDYISNQALGICSFDVFKEEREGREITDLAVALLVDCSGSMEYNSKSKCAFAASVMVALACEEAKIPTEVAAFSTGGILYLKKFGDDDSLSRDYLGVLYSSVANAYSRRDTTSKISLWGGTDCESALALLLDDIDKYKEKARKLLFVITDGETGDKNAVKKLVAGAKEEGTVVVAIGIGTDRRSLSECFDRYEVFTYKSLDKLPGYVADEIGLAVASENFHGY